MSGRRHIPVIVGIMVLLVFAGLVTHAHATAQSLTVNASIGNGVTTPTLVTPLNAAVAGTTPTLKATYGDPEGDTGTITFEVCSDPACASPVRTGTSASDLSSGANGSWTVTTALPDGIFYWRARSTDSYMGVSSWSSTRSFSTLSTPDITSVTPSTMVRGATGVAIQVTGTGFVSGAIVTVSGTGVSVDSVTFVNATRLDVVLSSATGTATGPRDVTVMNPDTGTTTEFSALTIVEPALPQYLGTGGSAADKTTGTTLVVPVSTAISANEFVVLPVAHNSPNVWSVTDSRGNLWHFDRRITNSHTTETWSSFITQALVPGDTIVINFSFASNVRAASLHRFSQVQGHIVDASGVGTGADAAPTASLTTTAARTLLFGAVGVNGLFTETYTPDAGFTAIPASGSSGGSAGSNLALYGAYRTTTTVGGYVASGTLMAARTWATTAVAYRIGDGIGTSPTLTTAPTISGTTTMGQTLTASDGTWSGASSYTRFWSRCDAVGASCQPIAGQTASALTLTAADVNSTIRATIVATNSSGSTSTTTAQTSVIAGVPPSNTVLPAITGTTQEGSTLTSSTGTWSGYAPMSFTFQWQRCTPGCVDIGGATTASYTLTAADAGTTVRARVTAANTCMTGCGTTSVTSATTSTVSASDVDQPTSAPTIVEGTSPDYQYVVNGTIPTVWYNPTVNGDFVVRSGAADATSGVKQVDFPGALLTGWTPLATTSVTTSPYEQLYRWDPGSAQLGLKNFVVTDDSANANTSTGSFEVLEDGTDPTSGSISNPPTLVGTLSVPLTVTAGSDGTGSGIASTIVKRDEGALSADSCTMNGTYADTVALVGGEDTSVLSGRCYSYRLVTTDNVGNSATSSQTTTVKVDAGSPTAPATANDGSGADVDMFSAFSVLINWSAGSDAETGVAAYEICLKAGTTSTDCTSALTTFTVANATSTGITTPSDGVYQYCVRSIDDAGNASTYTCSDGFTVDTTAPNNPTSAGIYDLSTTFSGDEDWSSSTTALSASWNVGSDAGSGIASYDSCFSTVSTGCTPISGTTMTTGNTTRTATTTGAMTSGSTYFSCVRTRDIAGNVSTWTCSDGFTIDTTSPSAPTTVSDGAGTDAASQSGSTVSANWTAGSDAASGVLDYDWCLSSSANCAGTVLATGTSATTSYSTSSASLVNGVTYYSSVRTRDTVGNLSTYASSNGFEFLGVNDAPDAPSGHAQFRSDGTTAIGAGAWTNQAMAVLTFRVTDQNVNQTLTPWVEVRPGSTAFSGTCGTAGPGLYAGTALVAAAGSTAVTASVTVSGLVSDTDYRWRACVVDQGGLASDWTARGGTPDFRVDTTTPTNPSTADIFDGVITATTDADFSQDGATLRGSWNAGSDAGSGVRDYDWCFSATTACSGSFGGNTTRVASHSPLPALVDGDLRNLCVRAVDNAGNQAASWSCSDGLTIDTTAPDGDISATPAGPVTSDVTLTGTITDTGSRPDSASISYDDGAGTTGTCTLSTISAPAATRSWSCDLPAASMGDGSYLITLSGADVVGNSGATIATRTIVVDNGAPTITMTGTTELSGTQFQHTSGSTLWVNPDGAGSTRVLVGASDPQTDVASVLFPPLGGGWTPAGDSVANPGPYEFTYDFAPTVTGAGAQSITAFDNAGNSASTELTVALDGALPQAGSISYADGVGATPSLVFSAGNDAGSGIREWYVARRQAATLSPTACDTGAWSGWAMVGTTMPVSPMADTSVSAATCYQYRLVVIDNVDNRTEYASAATFITPTPAVKVTAAAGGNAVTEGGAATSWTVVLTAAPTSATRIDVTGDARLELSTTSVTFDALNWFRPQTVRATAIDDQVDTTPDSVVTQVSHRAGSGDPAYTALAAVQLPVTVIDDDVAGIVVSTGSVSVSEPATSASFGVRLATRPTGSVTVSLASNSGQATVAPAALTFDASNWNVAQDATVTAVDDPDVDGAASATISVQGSSTTDAAYTGMAGASVVATVSDDDVPAMLVDATGLTRVSEATPETATTFQVRLGARPSADVRVAPTVPDRELRAPSGMLTFTRENWNQAQSVRVVAFDDAVAEPTPHVGRVVLTVASEDAAFAGLAERPVAVQVADDDPARLLQRAGVGWTPDADGIIDVREGGDAVVVSILADGNPTRTIRVEPVVSSSADVIVRPASAIIDPADPNQAHAFTVRAVDDGVNEDASESVRLTWRVTTLDPMYANAALSSTRFAVLDRASTPAPTADPTPTPPSGGSDPVDPAPAPPDAGTPDPAPPAPDPGPGGDTSGDPPPGTTVGDDSSTTTATEATPKPNRAGPSSHGDKGLGTRVASFAKKHPVVTSGVATGVLAAGAALAKPLLVGGKLIGSMAPGAGGGLGHVHGVGQLRRLIRRKKGQGLFGRMLRIFGRRRRRGDDGDPMDRMSGLDHDAWRGMGRDWRDLFDPDRNRW